MAKEAILVPRGLFSFPNAFSIAPPGAQQEAINVVIDREGIIQTRRGFDTYTNFGADHVEADQLVAYQNHLVGSVRDADLTGHVGYFDGSEIFQEYPGDVNVPDPTDLTSRVRFVQSNKNLYMTTANGIYLVDVYTGPATPAGIPRALGGTAVPTGGSGFQPDDTNVAYEIVWGIRDLNKNVKLGVPSQRIICSNSSGNDANVSLTFSIPASVDTTYFFQIYRTLASVDLATPPDNEFQQVYEANPTSGEILAGSITLTDSLPDISRQQTLYTSPSQQGAENANFEPPFANDVTLYKGCVIYANTRQKHNLTFTLIGAGSPGLDVGDTITFTETSGVSPVTFTLTGAASENGATGEFEVFTGGTPSENITDTCNSIIRVLNDYAANTILDAYYASGFEDLPGQLQVVRRDFLNISVAITSDNGTSFTPILPTSGDAVETEAEIAPNRIYCSKEQEPEAVPLYRFLDVGSAAFPIQRVLALRDSVIILKQDGVFRLYGQTFESFALSTLDNTVRIQGPNTAVTITNQVMFYSDQGVVAASDTGVKIVSRPIENTLLQLSSSVYPFFSSASHATAYESDRKYILWTVSEPEDERATQGFVYNIFTDSWTTWDREPTVGYVNPTDNKLYLGYYDADGSAPLARERKNYTRLDYADDSFTVALTTVSGNQVVVTDATGIMVGMTLTQGAISDANVYLREAVITVVNGTTLTLDASLSWSTSDPATVFTPIPVDIQTIPITGRAPLSMKRFTELNLVFDDASFDEVDVGFTSDFVIEEQVVALATRPTLGSRQRLRTYVPRNYTRCNFIQLSFGLEVSFSSMALNGYALDELPTGTRFK